MIHINVEFSYFALCSVLCREGLWSTLVYLGASLGEGKSGVKVGIVNTKVALGAPGKCPRKAGWGGGGGGCSGVAQLGEGGTLGLFPH